MGVNTELRYCAPDDVLHCLLVQVLEYDTETWAEIGRIKIPRGYGHAIVGANLGAICPATGNLKEKLDTRIPENPKLEHSGEGEGSTLFIAVLGLATSNGVLLLLLIGAVFLLHKMKNTPGNAIKKDERGEAEISGP